MTDELWLQPAYVIHISSDLKGDAHESFEAWKVSPCRDLSEHSLWGVFVTNESHLCLGVSKFERNGVVFVDYRLWNVTGGKFNSIFNEVGLMDDIKDKTFVEFWDFCSKVLYDISLHVNDYINS